MADGENGVYKSPMLAVGHFFVFAICSQYETDMRLISTGSPLKTGQDHTKSGRSYNWVSDVDLD